MVQQITKENIFEQLYSIVPEFKGVIDSEYDDEEKEIQYVLAYRLAQYTYELFVTKDFDQLNKILEYIELILSIGDTYAQELATVGFLEDIQTVWDNSERDRSEIYDLLLPESKKWWNQVDKFWNGKIKSIGETYEEEL